jgi:hypothetical protein
MERAERTEGTIATPESHGMNSSQELSANLWHSMQTNAARTTGEKSGAISHSEANKTQEASEELPGGGDKGVSKAALGQVAKDNSENVQGHSDSAPNKVSEELSKKSPTVAKLKESDDNVVKPDGSRVSKISEQDFKPDSSNTSKNELSTSQGASVEKADRNFINFTSIYGTESVQSGSAAAKKG